MSSRCKKGNRRHTRDMWVSSMNAVKKLCKNPEFQKRQRENTIRTVKLAMGWHIAGAAERIIRSAMGRQTEDTSNVVTIFSTHDDRYYGSNKTIDTLDISNLGILEIKS